jgi:hypothetical protein
MRIKKYKLFKESLEDDFKLKLNGISNDVIKKGKLDLFLSNLPDESKSEFMYRLSDGEDVISLIEEFLNKLELDNATQMEFRTIVFIKRIDEIQDESNYKLSDNGSDIIDGFINAESVDDFIQKILNLGGRDQIISIIKNI